MTLREPQWRVPSGRQTRHIIYVTVVRVEACVRVLWLFRGSGERVCVQVVGWQDGCGRSSGDRTGRMGGVRWGKGRVCGQVGRKEGWSGGWVGSRVLKGP